MCSEVLLKMAGKLQSVTAHLPHRPTARVNAIRVDHSSPLECLGSAMQQLCLVKGRSEALTATRKPSLQRKHTSKKVRV